MKELPKAYESSLYEDKIYKKWEESDLFNPDTCVKKGFTQETAKHFSIVLPPPNVTGTLHIGHASMLAIQDTMVRYHRMKGDKTLWLPGTDHAAIATQTKVEKLLMQKGMKDPRTELGREAFLKEVDKFAKESRDTIVNQSKKMGSSLDWKREAFTLDEPRNLAVRTVFKKMYDDGLIYRGYRIVNWCPRCHSTLADDEVEYKEQTAKLYTFRYSKDFPISIATTRPETKLGDTAVAVNPKDKRYKKYIGQTFEIKNFAEGTDLKIQIIGEESVDMDFGTGAVGVTPAHSHADYDMYKNHNLEMIKVIDEDGKMTNLAGQKYSGLSVLEARAKVVESLETQGLLEKEEEIPNNLSVCYRCGTPIEPIPSRQWFIDVNKEFKIKDSRLKNIKKDQNVTLKKLMQETVKSGQIEIIPERFDKTYFHWIDNLKDWCISRQLWYGHQIPVWYKKAKKGIKITFLRHGETQALVDGISSGRLETPLTEKGLAKARELKEKISDKFDHVFCSDLNRALETAKIIFGDEMIIPDKRLSEMDYGDLNGHLTTEVDPFRAIGYPNGEKYEMVRDRVVLFLSDLIDKYDGENIAIVAHSGIRKVLDVILGDKQLNQEHLTSQTPFDPMEYDLNEIFLAGVEAPTGDGWQQDPDTLDTWFSSGLWTFSTLGWPNETIDLKTFHPTSVMETGYDILFFWVARMILMTTYVLGDIPFEKVYLHGLVRDEQGRKMSKSLGNVIDPLDTISKYGADATRLSLIIGNTPGNDLKLNEEKVAGFRNFANKLWNISRFMLLNIDEPRVVVEMPKAETWFDEWILEELVFVSNFISSFIEELQFSVAGEELRDFTWNELADWYLEIAKIEGNKSEILNYILNTILKLWHPFMPFVTEAIWQEIYGAERMLMIEKWPRLEKNHNSRFIDNKNISFDSYFADFSTWTHNIQDIIVGVRSLKAEYKIDPVKKLKVTIKSGENQKLIAENIKVIKGLARLESLEFGDKPEGAVGFVAGDIEVFVDLSGAVDTEKEKNRITAEIENLQKYVSGLEGKLGNESFVQNAPKAVIENEQNKLAEAKEKLSKLQTQLKSLK